MPKVFIADALSPRYLVKMTAQQRIEAPMSVKSTSWTMSPVWSTRSTTPV